MNVHSPRWFQKWQPHEEEAIVSLLATGISHKAVAAKIGRTEDGVRLRACLLGVKSKYKHGRFIEPKPLPRLTIPKQLLSEFYAIGWRVESFAGQDCTLVWPHNSPPPVQAPHNSGERLPNSDVAEGGGEA